MSRQFWVNFGISCRVCIHSFCCILFLLNCSLVFEKSCLNSQNLVDSSGSLASTELNGCSLHFPVHQQRATPPPLWPMQHLFALPTNLAPHPPDRSLDSSPPAGDLASGQSEVASTLTGACFPQDPLGGATMGGKGEEEGEDFCVCWLLGGVGGGVCLQKTQQRNGLMGKTVGFSEFCLWCRLCTVSFDLWCSVF